MNESEEKLLKQFSDLKGALAKWGELVDKTLMDILDEVLVKEHRIKIEPSFRIKTDQSFLSKALWRKKEYINPILEIEDKIGTRVVMLSSSDLKESENLILSFKGWSVKQTKSIDANIEELPESFSYQSLHYVVNPLTTDIRFNDTDVNLLTCEIQIRTLLQHAYAEMSHDSAYKGPYKNDKGIIRHLAKSMALMEATDDYFCSIFDMMSDNTRFFSNYLSDLSRYFAKFDAEFKKDQLDLNLTDEIFSLLSLKKIGIDQIDEFITKREKELKSVIGKPDNGAIFGQPISILASYYFFNHKSWLKKEWPLNNESLKSIYKAYNTSFGKY